MQPKELAQQCVESISSNSNIRNHVQKANEDTRRTYLTLWHDGYRRANPKADIPNLNEFLQAATPEVQKAVAA